MGKAKGERPKGKRKIVSPTLGAGRRSGRAPALRYAGYTFSWRIPIGLDETVYCVSPLIQDTNQERAGERVGPRAGGAVNREIEPPFELGLPYWFHLFFPDRLLTTELRILVVGCDDETALRLARANPRARVTAVEQNAAVLENAARGCEQRGLANLELLADWPAAPPAGEAFDLVYYNAAARPGEPSGVLDRAAELLRRDGSLHLTVRAEHAWAGVRTVRELLDRLGVRPSSDGYPRARQIVAALGPEHPWSLLGPEAPLAPDELLADWLRPEEPSFSVPQVYGLLAASGLTLQRFTYQAYYLPQCSLLARTPLLAEVRQLPLEQQQALMELYWPGVRYHLLVACRADRPAATYRTDFDGGEWTRYAPLLPARLPLEDDPSQFGAKARLCWRAAAMPEVGLGLGGFQYRLLRTLDRAEELGEVIGLAGLSGDPELRDQWARDFFRLMADYDFLHFRTCCAPEPLFRVARRARGSAGRGGGGGVTGRAAAGDAGSRVGSGGRNRSGRRGGAVGEAAQFGGEAVTPESTADGAASGASASSGSSRNYPSGNSEASEVLAPAQAAVFFEAPIALPPESALQGGKGSVEPGAMLAELGGMLAQQRARAAAPHDEGASGASAEAAAPDTPGASQAAQTAPADDDSQDLAGQLERVLYEACPLCNESDCQPVRQDGAEVRLGAQSVRVAIPWLRCARCAHVFTAGYFTGETWRRVLETSLAARGTLERALESRARASRIVAAITVLRERAAGRWLDAGCSHSGLMAVAAEYGYDSVGVDCCPQTAERLTKLGYAVRLGSLFDCNDGPYDVVSLSGLLDRMPFPTQALSHVRRLLAKGGLVFVSTPSSDSLAWRNLDFEGANPYWARVERYHNFDRKSVFRLLQEAGFDPCSYGVGAPEPVGMEVVACRR